MAEAIERLLVVQPQGIGDVIMMTPALSGLRAIASDLKVALVVRNRAAADVLRGSGLTDAVFVLDRRSATLRGAVGRVLEIRRQFKPDACIVAPHVSPSYGQLFAFLVGAQVRIGSHNAWPVLKFTHTIPESLGLHKAEAMLAFAKVLYPDCEAGAPVCVIDQDAQDEALEVSRRLGIASKVLLGIHPGTDASGTMRRYSPEYFKQIVASYRRTFDNAHAVVFLGPNDEDLHPRFAGVEGVTVISGLSIRVVAALIRTTAVFLGSDSALVHVAAAVGVPTVTIFGPADPRRTRPISALAHVVQHRPLLSCMPCIDNEYYEACRVRPCLSSLPPAHVFGAVVRAMRREPAHAAS